MSSEPVEIQNWRSQLAEYQNNKKQPRPELYRNPNYIRKVTHAEIKISEYKFDPILNRYKDRQLDQAYYSQSVGRMVNIPGQQSGVKYNIVTLEDLDNEPSNSFKSKRHGSLSKNYMQPFNIISNEVYNPAHKMFRIRQKKLPDEMIRDYNIVNNRYWLEHEAKTNFELEMKNEKIQTKYASTHDFDPIRGIHYFEDKENQRLKNEEVQNEQMIKRKLEKLPKSYKTREPINLNHEHNLIQSDGFVQYKSPEETRITRHRMKHDLETMIREKGIQQQDRADNMCLERYFAQRFVEEYKEGVNPLNLQKVESAQLRLEFAKGNKKDHFLPFPKASKKFTNYFGQGF
jgi:hypothetical protein